MKGNQVLEPKLITKVFRGEIILIKYIADANRLIEMFQLKICENLIL